jgi:hypothetical protein
VFTFLLIILNLDFTKITCWFISNQEHVIKGSKNAIINKFYYHTKFGNSCILKCLVATMTVKPRGIVFKFNPVQGSGFGFWPGYRIAQVNFFLFKSKRRCFNEKNKNQRIVNGFLAGSLRVFLFLIFFKPGPIPTLSRPTKPGFKTIPRHMSRRARRANGQPK